MGKVCSLDELIRRRAALRKRGRVVVFTNGCFDLLHVGHVRYLRQARALGDCLIVGVNDDDSVRRLKGEGRPLQCEADRAEILAALACVDYAALFGEDTAERLVADIQPDIYVKGGDYAAATREDLLRILPEARVVFAYGGDVRLLPFVAGKSTTEIVQRMSEGGEP
jgi:D-glycero-beta-D-manno-heptose 1-phosphate adenylyltransferase